MEDMKAAVSGKHWAEILEKADRVAPAQRTPEWNQQVRQAAVGRIDELDGNDSSAASDLANLLPLVPQIETKYSFLKSDAQYTEAKGKALRNVVETCAKRDTYNCGAMIELLAKGVTKFPPGIAKKIALIISTERFTSESIRFWSLAVKEDAASACGDGRLKMAVINSLKSKLGPEQAEFARSSATGCFAVLETALMDELGSSKEGDDFVANACPVLVAKGKTGVKVKKLCGAKS